MRCTLVAFLQSCALLLVRADQWRLKESCVLNRKVSPSSPLPPQCPAASSTKPIRLQTSETITEGFSAFPVERIQRRCELRHSGVCC